MREIKASVEDVVGEDKVPAKTAPLDRKKIQSTKSFFIWQFPHAFDHPSRQALFDHFIGMINNQLFHTCQRMRSGVPA